METQTFEAAPLDAYAERMSSGIAMLGGVLMLPALFWFLSGIGLTVGWLSGVFVSAGLAAALLVWLILGYAVQPVEYRFTSDLLTVKRRWFRALKVELKDVAGVAPTGAMADASRRGVRRALNLGVFGYHGRFQLQPYGQVFLSATHLEKVVAIHRPGQAPLLISPARPRAFVEALREAMTRDSEMRMVEDAV